MVNHKKPGWVLRLFVVVLALPVLYVGSFGPACWATSRTGIGATQLARLYWPIVWQFHDPLVEEEGTPLEDALKWYANLGAAQGWCWTWELGVRLDAIGRIVKVGIGDWEWCQFE